VNEVKSAENEVPDQAHELDTNSEGDHKEEKKQEASQKDSSISIPIIDLRCEDNQDVIEGITTLNADANPYKTRILLLRKYTEVIASEVEKMKSTSSLLEKSRELSLAEEECNHIVSLLKKIFPYIALGIFFFYYNRT